MNILLNDVLNGLYKELDFNKEIEGYKSKTEKVLLKDENGENILDEEGLCFYTEKIVKEPVMLRDNVVSIIEDGMYSVIYKKEDEDLTVNYFNRSNLIKYVGDNGEDAYYVSYTIPRVRGNRIISGELIDSYILNKHQNNDAYVCKSNFNSNINQSDVLIDNMNDFISFEGKDENLTYIVGDVYEVYFDGNMDVNSKDYNENDYNDWFVRVMRNDTGAYVEDGDIVMGYLLKDFIENKDYIESRVYDVNNRVNIYKKDM